MTVKRLPPPALLPDSEAGGTMADRLSMSAVGSTPVVNPPSVLTPLSQLAVNQTTPDIPVSTERPRDGSGKFTEDTSAWSQAGSDAAGWKVC